ncbi:MAG: ethanolamine utilization microcompartment protein EutL [Oscillospiraceae bacterium]|jgi:ethanolamine utilization protein EutL|nr:ethanolamine utilization microcompartment protein EutL [Oscillospiraceae bacterium]
MIGDRIPAHVLATRILPNADAAFLAALGAKTDGSERALGFFTCDSDDVAYAALDEATKKAGVRVLYAKSLYAGAGNASTALAGEFFGVLAGESPDEVRAGLDAALFVVADEAAFYSANEADTVCYFAHCIAASGTYLSSVANLPMGAPLAYLIAPPLEAMAGLDAALKAADVRLCAFWGPPSETNFAGALLTGDQAACRAACNAFADTVCAVAATPLA